MAKLNDAGFREALITAYCDNPCQVLPNALWKMLAMVQELKPVAAFNESGATHLDATDGSRLMILWDRNRNAVRLPYDASSLDFALLHHDYMDALPDDVLLKRETYFRLSCGSEASLPPDMSPGFRLADALPHAETARVTNLINSCYDTIQISEAVVKQWIGHPVFSADLWIWVIDEQTDCPVGLGIAEYDDTVSEGSLEWVQVLPGFRGRGLGTSLVRALQMKLRDRAAFLTVSGAMGDLTSPESLYRRCGFQGDDIWHVLRA